MRFLNHAYLLLSLLPVLVRSQGENTSYVQSLVSALQGAGLDGLANVVSTLNGSGEGQALFADLATGNNYTVFAPTNEAIQSIPSSITGNSTLLAEYVSYHIVSGDFLNASWTNTSSGGGSGGETSSSTLPTSSAASSSFSSFSPTSSVITSSFVTSESGSLATITITATPSPLLRSIYRTRKSPSLQSNTSNPQPYAGVWPNVTIGRTLLNASEFVNLPGDKNQVLAWTRSGENGNVTILNQIENVTVVGGALWQNLLINFIDGYLTPPDSLSTALTAVGATNTRDLLSAIPVSSDNGTNTTALDALASARGITLLIPNNDAFTSSVNMTLQGLMNNSTAVSDLLQNHYVNGSSIYSTELTDGSNATTAAGQTLAFTRNATGLFVSTPNGTSAQVVRPDVLLSNGVGHVINSVLIDTDSDPSAASSAYSSATASAASATTTETGPIGVFGGPTSGTTTITSSPTSSTPTSTASSVQSSASSAFSSASSAFSSASSASSTESSTSPSTTTTPTPSTSTTAGGGTITVTASAVA